MRAGRQWKKSSDRLWRLCCWRLSRAAKTKAWVTWSGVTGDPALSWSLDDRPLDMQSQPKCLCGPFEGSKFKALVYIKTCLLSGASKMWFQDKAGVFFIKVLPILLCKGGDVGHLDPCVGADEELSEDQVMPFETWASSGCCHMHIVAQCNNFLALPGSHAICCWQNRI